MANKILVQRETQIRVGSQVGDDVAWTTESVGNGAGRRAAVRDWGAAPQTDEFDIELFCQAVATPTLLAPLRGYIYTAGHAASAAHSTAVGGTTDAAIGSEDDLTNQDQFVAVRAHAAAADTEFVKPARVQVAARHWSLSLWNALGAALTVDDTETAAIITPIPPEIQ